MFENRGTSSHQPDNETAPRPASPIHEGDYIEEPAPAYKTNDLGHEYTDYDPSTDTYYGGDYLPKPEESL